MDKKTEVLAALEKVATEYDEQAEKWLTEGDSLNPRYGERLKMKACGVRRAMEVVKEILQ